MTTTPANCAPKTQQQMAKMHRWKSSALAAAALALAGLHATEASALALGRINVKSSLGEPLRAEIELPQITPAEADTLRVQTAAPEVFRAHGMEYSATVTGVQVEVQRRSDGSMVLRLTSTRPVSEPFVDLVLDASWSSGQIMRSYTMLLDPPALRKVPPTVTAAAQTSSPRDTSTQRGNRAAAPQPRPEPVAPVATPSEAIAPESRPERTERPQRPQRPERTERPERTTKAAARTRPTAPAAPTPVPTPAPESVTVRPGDTATRLALAHRLSGVSLDQMLVAMQRSNPNAFAQGNIHRLKSGAVVNMPDAEQAQAVPAAQARQMVAAQSRDFGEFRRKLAATVPSAAVAASGRSASGKVQAKVEDKRPSTAAPDKLTLSKGALKGQKAAAAQDDKLIKDKQASESAARLKEISRNIAELKKLKTEATAPAPLAAASSASTPGITVPIKAAPVPAPLASTPAAPTVRASVAPLSSPAVVASAPASTAASSPMLSASTPASASAPALAASSAASTPASALAPVSAPVSAPMPALAASQTASAPAPVSASIPEPVLAPASAAASAPAPAPKPTPLPVPPVEEPAADEPSFLDSLIEDPLVPAAGGGLLALLLGFVGYRAWQRKRQPATGVDSTFIESKMPPDSFFGQSGGQHVDTNNTDMSTGSSMAYSPSQLDTGGDVDPVAEADVYLAYGRDLQAEEILKEAARHNPTRVSIHVKLAEIYAKRQDRKALETAAAAVFEQTDGQGSDWARVAELGRLIDPENAMYQPGGTPSTPSSSGTGVAGLPQMPDFFSEDSAPAPLTDFPSTTPGAPLPPARAQAPAVQPPDFDLDLDLVLPSDEDRNQSASKAAPGQFAAAAAFAATAAPTSAPALDLPSLPELNLDLGTGMGSMGRRGTEPVLEPLPMLEPLPDLGAALEPTLDLPDFSTLAPMPKPEPEPPAKAAPKAPTEEAPSLSIDLDFPTGDLQLAESAAAPLTALPSSASAAKPAAKPPAKPAAEPEASLEFDLGDLSFDLGDMNPKASAKPAAAPAASTPTDAAQELDESDPLATKLALAEEFYAMEDTDGARSMIEEVIAEASGPLKERAQRLLASMT